MELFRGGDLENSMYRNLSGVLKLTEQLKSSWHKTFDAQFMRPLRRVLEEDLVFPEELHQSVLSARDKYDHALFGVYEGYKKDSPRSQVRDVRQLSSLCARVSAVVRFPHPHARRFSPHV
jgi:hypothetical protein